MVTLKQVKRLYAAAKKVVKLSYSPYSKFPVGAAVLTKSGKIFTGTNVENVSYGLTICAERVAVCNAVSNGYRDIIAIAIYSDRDGITPCGACRQFIAEFGERILVIYKKQGKTMAYPISDLLPEPFTSPIK